MNTTYTLNSSSLSTVIRSALDTADYLVSSPSSDDGESTRTTEEETVDDESTCSSDTIDPPDRRPTFQTGLQGGNQVSYDGYTYSHSSDHASNGNSYWACKDKKKYKPHCKGRIGTNSSGDVYFERPHCHSRDLTEVGVQQFDSELRTVGTEGDPATVVRKLLLKTPQSVQCHLPHVKALRKRVTEKRRRDRGYPTCTATCAREYIIPLPTIDERMGGLLLLEDILTSQGKRVVGISSKTTLCALNQPHQYLFLDGTFKVSPKFFRQIWIVHGHVLDSAEVAPLAYFLLEDQTKSSYLTALEILKRHCPNISVEIAVADFEQAEHQAINETFPDADIQGCLFHWKQCLVRRFEKIPGYKCKNADVTLREKLHSLFGLAFIPESDIVPCWTELKQILSLDPILLPVLEYVESEWICNDRIYPVRMWNVYQTVLDGGPRTNNFAEGHNHALALAARCSHPGIELLLEILTLYNTDAELAIHQTLSGMVLVPKRKKTYVELDQRIKNAVPYYGRTDVETYCRALGHLTHKRS